MTLFGMAARLLAQEGPVLAPHVPYVATPPAVAEAMLSIAKVGPSDIVYDLGCGDGRIVILAAQKFGARGVGIDIDADRIREANANAARAGVSDKVRFLHADLFFADVHEATVVTMFLLPSINVKLRPKLFRQLAPGTRVVTQSLDIGDWPPERRINVGSVPVYLWSIPETMQAKGRVVLQDEDAPPAASIERVCDASVRFEGYTDAHGRFTLFLPRGERESGCRIRAVLPGFRSTTALLASELETIRLERIGACRGSVVSAVSKASPRASMDAFDRGREALARGQPGHAEQHFTRAVELFPRFAAAWFELGRLFEAQGRVGDARNAYEKSVAADPAFISPYLGLAQLAVHANDWRAVAGYMESVLELDPENFPDAWLYHAVGSLTLKNYDAAEQSARAAMRLDTSHQLPRAEYVLGLALAMKGELAEAKAHLSHYLELDPKAPDRDAIRQRLAEMKH